MPPVYSHVLDRARDAAALLDDAQRKDARRVIEICADIASRARTESGRLTEGSTDPALRVELGRLAEVLGRRSAHAIPLASLARAALADLAGRADHAAESIQRADSQLGMYGL